MKARIAKSLFAVWFSLLVALGNTPMDFIHQFADHTDTIHKERRGVVIEKKHHHCAYLSITLATFISDHGFSYEFRPAPEFFTRQTVVCSRFVQRNIIAAVLRGPPVV